MPYKLGTVVAPDKTPLLVIQAEAEPVPVLDVLRMIKTQFPEEYRQVHYEIQPASPINRIVGINGDAPN